jgi:hypothetical protein
LTADPLATARGTVFHPHQRAIDFSVPAPLW